MVRDFKSVRQFRQMFAGLIPLETASTPFLTARRLRWREHSGSGYVLRSMRRAVSGFNVMGKRIWFPKPQMPRRSLAL